MKVDELIALGGTAPPFPTKPLPRDVMEEVTKIYYEIYVPGLCQFFETQWYNFKNQGPNPITVFLENKPLVSLIAEFLNVLRTVSTSDQGQMAYSGNLETRVVWGLTTLAYRIPQSINSPRDDSLPEDDATELRNRLYVFETLLTGEILASNPLLSPPKNADAHRKNEYEFWYLLAEFLRQTDGSQRERLLTRLRHLLEGRENRDVLYSLAILRELSPRFAPGYENKVEPHLDESEPRNKLHVATQFINAEASNTGGTTNVVRRFAFIATKAFINPGINISRKA